MNTRAKQKSNTLAPPGPPPARRPGPRSTSESHPGTPVNPSATPALPDATPPLAPVPAPKTPKDAISLLTSHGLITKNPTLNPSVIVCLLHGLASFPKVIENGHYLIISAIALLVPLAMDNTNAIRADLDEFKAKVVSLEEKVDKVLGLVENPMTLEEDVGDKLDKMLSTLNDSASKAEAAEQAAISTQNKLTSLLEAQNQTDRRPWHRVKSKNSGSHREPAPHIPAPAPPARAAPPPLSAAKSKERDTLARQRAHAQAATILIQPVPGAEGSTMDKKTEPALLKWIREAMVTTWQQLADAGHFKELGLSETPRVGFLHATRLPSGGVLFKVASLHHAALLSTVRVSKALQANLGDVECRGQRADILLASAPIEVNPEDPEFQLELERDNQLEPGIWQAGPDKTPLLMYIPRIVNK
ncbi:hypothetical protein FRC12_019265 [Ceratobasidium sp. 428]|nr:hypothetical protein FRC12_019265 [Ceratobasidium sp. 428]